MHHQVVHCNVQVLICLQLISLGESRDNTGFYQQLAPLAFPLQFTISSTDCQGPTRQSLRQGAGAQEIQLKRIKDLRTQALEDLHTDHPQETSLTSATHVGL